MGHSALKRITRELQDFMRDPPPGCTAEPVDDDNLFDWNATIEGPKDTPYEGGLFRLFIRFSKNHPFTPPEIIFTTKIYHSNITFQGGICMDILENSGWSPALTIDKVLLSICSLLSSPEHESPFFFLHRWHYNKMAKKWTEKYAK